MRPFVARLAMAITLPVSLVCATQAHVQTKRIALPNIECDNCTVQMLQVLGSSSR